MKNVLFLLVVLLSVSPALRAQRTAKVSDIRVGAGRFEGEIAAGATFGYRPMKFYSTPSAGICVAVEGRYNFRQRPFDVGLRAGISIGGRHSLSSCSSLFFPVISLLAVSDYNLCVLPRLTFFAGVGVGPAYVFMNKIIEAEGIYGEERILCDKIVFCAMPRVGIECWNRLRISLGYMYTERANRHFSATLGIAIGGGRYGYYFSGKP